MDEQYENDSNQAPTYESSGGSSEPVDVWEADELMNPRPKWPKVVGIFSILYGVFGLTCGALGLASAQIVGGVMKTALEGDPMPYGMVMTPVDYIIGGTGLLLAGCLLFAGITAVTYRPLTRLLHLVYGMCSMPLGVWGYLNQVGKQELNQQWAVEYPNNQMAPSMSASNAGAAIGEAIGLGIFILLGIGIPVFYLVWFGLWKTKPEQITGDEEGVY